jgi:hypothetical protein
MITGFSRASSSKATNTTSPTARLLNTPGVMFINASASTGPEFEAYSNNGILTIQRLPVALIDCIIALVINVIPPNTILSNNLANRFNKNKVYIIYYTIKIKESQIKFI